MENLDITQTGPLKHNELQELNNLTKEEIFQLIDSLATPPSTTELQRQRGLGKKVTPVGNILAEHNYGASKYDPESLTDISYVDSIENIRSLNQPWYSKLANGIAKFGVLAGTTFLDGTLGLATGLGTMAAEGKWRTSALWDNPFSQAMKDINEWSEKNLPNYYTDYEKEAPFHKNIFSANFIGDKFIKNLGFTLGAFYSGGVITAPLKGVKATKFLANMFRSSRAPGIVKAGVGSAFSAINEARIEALNNSTDWANLQTMKLEDEYARSIENINQMYGDSDLAKTLIEQENANYEESLAEISKYQAKMGNANMLFNLPVLMAANIVQFGKILGGGATTARRINNIKKKAAGTFETTTGKAGSITRALLNPLSEGTEEMAQTIASTASGNYYEDKLDSFYKKKIDPEAELEAISWIKAFGQAINETVNDNSAWEEFFIGTLTGALGMPTFGKAFTLNESTWLGKGKQVGLSGGIVGELVNQRNDKIREQAFAADISNIMQSDQSKSDIQHLTAIFKINKEQDMHLENDDMFEFNNSRHQSFVNNISKFDTAGHLSEYISLIETALDTSDDNLDAIAENTVEIIKDANGKEIKVGPFIDEEGNPMHSTPEGKQEMIDKINKYKTGLINKVEEYRKVKEQLDISTGQILSDDLLHELVWMKTQTLDWERRSEEISSEAREVLEKIKGGINREISVLQQKKTVAGVKGVSKEELSAGASYGDISLEYKAYEGAITRAQNRVQQIESVLTLPDKILGTFLASDESRALIAEELNNGIKEGYLSVDEAAKTLKGTEDLSKIYKGMALYTKRLNDYISNPNLLADEIEQAELEVLNQEAEKVVNSMDNVTTLKQFKERLSKIDNPKLIEGVLNYLESSDKVTLKNLAAESKKLQDSKEVINEILSRSQILPNHLMSILAIVEDAFSNAESLQEAEKVISDFITQKPEFENLEEVDNMKEVQDLLRQLMDTYNVTKKAKSTNENDSKPPKKSTAKKKTPNKRTSKTTNKKSSANGETSLFDKTTSDPNTPDAGLEEHRDNSKKKPASEAETPEKKQLNKDAELEALEAEKKKAIEKIKTVAGITETSEPAKGSAKPKYERTGKYLSSKVGNTFNKEAMDLSNSFYELVNISEDGNSAEFIFEDTKSIAAINNFNAVFDEVSEYEGDPTKAESVATLKPGKVIKEDNKWKVTEPVLVILLEPGQTISDYAKSKNTDKVEKEIKKVEELYKRRAENIINPPISTGDVEANSNAEINATSSAQESATSGSLRSWKETQYEFNELKDRRIRKIKRRSNPTVDALEKLGVYSFVDSGKLGKLILKHPKTKIHYVLSKDPALSDIELLAIEVTPEVEKIVGRVENAVIINDKKYQFVGALGFNSKNPDSKNNIQGIKRILREESDGYKGHYFVSELLYNHVSHMYSGRMVKSTETSDVTQKNVDKQFLGGEELHLGFYYREDDFRTPTIDRESELVEPLNNNNNNPKEGSIWLMSKEADGKWYAKAVLVKRFTNEEFPLLENKDTPIVKELLDNLTIFVDPKSSQTDRLYARDIIEGWLHFPKTENSNHSLLFKEIKDNEGNVTDVIVSLSDIGHNLGEGQSVLDKAFSILTALQDDRLNLRFQISPSQMLNESEVDIILESGILTTDLHQLRNVNASFDLYLNDLNTGAPITGDKKEASLGHSGKRGINSSLLKETVMIGSRKYYINQEGIITDARGKRVTDSDKISEILLFRDIIRDTGTRYKNSNLFLGVYKDGSEFGIKGKKILTGEELSKEKDKIDKITGTKAKKETVKKVSEKITKIEKDINEKDAYGELEDVLISESNTPKDKVDKVIKEIEKETKKEKEDMSKKPAVEKTGTIKKAPVKGPFIGNSFNDTVLGNRNAPKTIPFRAYLKNNEDVADALLAKLDIATISEINDAVKELKLPNIETLKTDQQIKDFIDTVLNCR